MMDFDDPSQYRYESKYGGTVDTCACRVAFGNASMWLRP